MPGFPASDNTRRGKPGNPAGRFADTSSLPDEGRNGDVHDHTDDRAACAGSILRRKGERVGVRVAVRGRVIVNTGRSDPTWDRSESSRLRSTGPASRPAGSARRVRRPTTTLSRGHSSPHLDLPGKWGHDVGSPVAHGDSSSSPTATRRRSRQDDAARGREDPFPSVNDRMSTRVADSRVFGRTGRKARPTIRHESVPRTV
jgi:hypothetical protein